MNLWIGIKSYFACGWSALTYIFSGMPKDKESYWVNSIGFDDDAENLKASIAAYKADPSFHTLKDVGVEWNKVWPQRSFKVTALAGFILGVIGFILGIAIAVCLLSIF